MANKLEETTIRDFGGGWNVSDSDKSLGSRYQPVSDNIVRGTDGHFRPRYGDKLYADFRDGVETTVGPQALTITTTSGESFVKITKTAHGYTSGDHVSIVSFSADLNDITVEQMERIHGIVVNDADNFTVYTRGVATSSGAASRTIAWIHDTHTLSARDIFGRYYRDWLFVFCENGEIGTMDIDGNVARVWSYEIAAGLTLEPWSQCERVSAEIVRGRLIAVNGARNDKPIAISGTTVNYLVDASTLSNGAIPRADFVIATSQYVVLVNTEYGATMLEIGARNTVMTCSRETSPSDAVEVDVGMLTQTVDATILGASVVRSRVFLGFADMSMLGTLGIYTDIGGSPVHEPDFNDNIAKFGTFSHASIISLGNDLYCAGLNGINSLEISRQSAEFVPQTISDLIHPVMLRHFSRLSEDDRRYRVFAVYDTTAKSYMLFAPKYSDTSYTLEPDPVFVTSTLQESNLVYIRFPNHRMDEGDYIDIAGAVDYSALLPATIINGRRRIKYVVDASTLVVECDEYLPNLNVSFGGSAVTISPVNDETIAYVYENNMRLKIRRWTRFRGLDYDWGTTSQFNRLFFGKNGKVYQYGDTNNQFSADKIGDYDYRSFANSLPYTPGIRVKDTTDGLVYECLIAHVSPASGTFAAARAAAPTLWKTYTGKSISWRMETAWTDFGERKTNKQIELVSFDTEGTGQFEFSIFTNNIVIDKETYERQPNRVTAFVGQDTPGFGGGDQPFGGGRNTAQEWLHSMPAFGKLFRLAFAGQSTHPLKINAATVYYHKSSVLT